MLRATARKVAEQQATGKRDRDTESATVDRVSWQAAWSRLPVRSVAPDLAFVRRDGNLGRPATAVASVEVSGLVRDACVCPVTGKEARHQASMMG